MDRRNAVLMPVLIFFCHRNMKILKVQNKISKRKTRSEKEGIQALIKQF